AMRLESGFEIRDVQPKHDRNASLFVRAVARLPAGKHNDRVTIRQILYALAHVVLPQSATFEFGRGRCDRLRIEHVKAKRAKAILFSVERGLVLVLIARDS